MKNNRPGRYSILIRPISICIDIGLLIFLVNDFLSFDKLILFIFCISLSWIFTSKNTNFYEVYRFTKTIKIFSLLVNQFFIYSFVFFGLCFLFDEIKLIDINLFFNFISKLFLIVSFFKFFIYFSLKAYRSRFKGNSRRVIIIGNNKTTLDLSSFFKNKKEYGYNLVKSFNSKDPNSNLEDILSFLSESLIDEIYCSNTDLSSSDLQKLIKYTDNNLILLKFLPDKSYFYSNKFKYQYYDYIPVLSFREVPLDYSTNSFFKRFFDIIFSLFVLVFVLSWLTPIIALLIRLESKGPVFFVQKRNGYNYKEFNCFKFRSMKPNPNAHLKQATKGDSRITKVGAFIRKTSIDELPQFYNVLFGHMSIVGPRPHMVSHTEMYAKKVDKFMVRHFVKPGITGLAQVSGYRGEIESDKDIIGRVKYDIFYLENWSFLLDVKIIIKTVINAVRGEDKAY